jgi:hypothetical protein
MLATACAIGSWLVLLLAFFGVFVQHRHHRRLSLSAVERYNEMRWAFLDLEDQIRVLLADLRKRLDETAPPASSENTSTAILDENSTASSERTFTSEVVESDSRPQETAESGAPDNIEESPEPAPIISPLQPEPLGSAPKSGPDEEKHKIAISTPDTVPKPKATVPADCGEVESLVRSFNDHIYQGSDPDQFAEKFNLRLFRGRVEQSGTFKAAVLRDLDADTAAHRASYYVRIKGERAVVLPGPDLVAGVTITGYVRERTREFFKVEQSGGIRLQVSSACIAARGIDGSFVVTTEGRLRVPS